MILAEEAPAASSWWDTVVTWVATVINWEQIGGVLGVLIGTFVIQRILILIVRRTVTRIVSGAKTKSHIEETSQILVSPLAQARVIQRTRTIGSALENFLTWILVFIALGTILAILNFNVGAIVASAGIIGAALAFGAQNIVKDLLAGMFMVFEDQLGVGDIVDVGTVSGFVEAVGVRVTKIRDVDGTLWYVRNGEIIRVGNKSQGWGRAVVEITVPSDQNLSTVEDALTEAATDVTTSVQWKGKVVGQPEVWGLDTLTGVGMVFKLAVKTRPAQQTDLSRALRRAIHDRFAATGIPLITTDGRPVTLRATSSASKAPKGSSSRPATGSSPKLKTQPTPLPGGTSRSVAPGQAEKSETTDTGDDTTPIEDRYRG
ncbi:MAG TPA: mechanosensitive ion channel [Pseudoclavibacter sp.]|nr:mechanosensitive ion channel [Pseudoclavibacter sp.]